MEKKRVALQGSYVDVYPQWPYPPFHAQALERGKHKRDKKNGGNMGSRKSTFKTFIFHISYLDISTFKVSLFHI